MRDLDDTPPVQKFKSFQGQEKSWRSKDQGRSENQGSDKRRDLRERLREVNEEHDSKAQRGGRDKKSLRDSDSAHQRLNDELREHVGRSNTD